MKISHKGVCVLSAISWLGIGIMLLTKGFGLLLHPLEEGQSYLFMNHISFLSSNLEQSGLFLICLALMIGFLKGKMVLGKSASKIIKRLESFPNPCPISSIYPISYLLVLMSMMGLGISLRWIPIAVDLKGIIDVAVGSALTNGSAFYVRHLLASKKVSS